MAATNRIIVLQADLICRMCARPDGRFIEKRGIISYEFRNPSEPPMVFANSDSLNRWTLARRCRYCGGNLYLDEVCEFIDRSSNQVVFSDVKGA